jgi:hypothetical protein
VVRAVCVVLTIRYWIVLTPPTRSDTLLPHNSFTLNLGSDTNELGNVCVSVTVPKPVPSLSTLVALFWIAPDVPSSQSIVHEYNWLQSPCQVAVTVILEPMKNTLLLGTTLVTTGLVDTIDIVWVHVLELPAASVTVQCTVLVGMLKIVEPVTTAPDAFVSLGTLESVPADVQLSVAVGEPSATAAQPLSLPLHGAVFGGKVMFGAHSVIIGTCVSTIVTVKLHDWVLPLTSVAVAVTVVTPTGNEEPEAGV